MKAAVILLVLVLLGSALSAEESCVGRCGSFESQSKCQCDSMCVYYGSCCGDFDAACPQKSARGDTFDETDDITEQVTTLATSLATSDNTVATTASAPTASATTASATTASAPTAGADAAPCSGQPFDAFLQLKNGSIYAFRGEYFFELDDTSILPGYPKLIQDVWGIPGPIDAAFTRINCQGKTYIFKGTKYWRFDGDVLDEDYPRDISDGFENVPNDIDAAFAIPAPNHRGKEKAYFFKGAKYYQYAFRHQPSHEECIQMTRSSPSVLFTRYTDLYCDQTLEDLFTELFGSSLSSHHTDPRFISRDWYGVGSPIDAALVGQVYLTPKPTAPPPARRSSSRRKRPSKKHGHRRRKSRYAMFDDLWGYDDWFDFSDFTLESSPQEKKSAPVQNVYFFKRDKYYRADLQTKRVSSVSPPYPRSIAKYWLGCKDEEIPDGSRAEKK